MRAWAVRTRHFDPAIKTTPDFIDIKMWCPWPCKEIWVLFTTSTIRVVSRTIRHVVKICYYCLTLSWLWVCVLQPLTHNSTITWRGTTSDSDVHRTGWVALEIAQTKFIQNQSGSDSNWDGPRHKPVTKPPDHHAASLAFFMFCFKLVFYTPRNKI